MTNSNIEITQAKPSDVKFIVAFSYALFQEDAGQRDPTINLEWAREEGKAYFSDLVSNDDDICLLASIEGRVVGYLAGRVIAPSSYRLIKQAELESMFVQDGYRGRKIGTYLTDRFLEWAKEKDARQVTVSAYEANDKAIAFYKKLGFQPRNIILQLGLDIAENQETHI
jgi:ribosomal protein S18 acetylase RimI-like enzyme